jgi:hypothetical protein
MQRHNPTHVARTLAEANALGHEDTDIRPDAKSLADGIHFAVSAGSDGDICWTGLCGDPEPGYRQVKYTDSNGLCNIYKKVRC